MNSAPLLLQQASGPCEALLCATLPRHAAYARALGLDYRASYGRECGPYLKGLSANWDKIALLLRTFLDEPENRIAVYVDADAVIVGSENIAYALPDWAELGLVQTQMGFFNTGVMCVRNTAAIRLFLARMLQLGESSGGATYADQQRLNDMLPGSGLKFVRLNARWNSYDNAAGPLQKPVQVVAFHSMLLSPREKLNRMQEVLRAAA